jgi:hypothetical protein
VTTTPGKIFAGDIDTGNKFIAGDNVTGEQFLPVSLTLMLN